MLVDPLRLPVQKHKLAKLPKAIGAVHALQIAYGFRLHADHQKPCPASLILHAGVGCQSRGQRHKAGPADMLRIQRIQSRPDSRLQPLLCGQRLAIA